jgi:hypothetical protein
MKNNVKMNKKIKLVASTNSARIGTLLATVAIVAVVVSLILQGVLNFEETLGVTIGVIAAATLVSVILITANFGGYLFFDLAKKEITLCKNFKKTVYSLDLISKIQLEAKTIDLHMISKTTEQETKNGTGMIKQKEYKKVHYKVPFYKNLDQRKRYDVFAQKCNKILTEVIHKKQIVEIPRTQVVSAK